MNPVTIGRIVGYVLPEGHSRAGEVVPAIVTRIWGPVCVQLTPFVDTTNDEPVNLTSCSSVMYDESLKPRSWHWLPRSEAAAKPAKAAKSAKPEKPSSAVK